MRSEHAPTAESIEPLSDGDVVDLEPAADDSDVDAAPEADAEARLLRSRLAIIAAFLALFHLLFTLVKVTAPPTGTASVSDAPVWSLLVRVGIMASALAVLRSPLSLTLRQLRFVEGGMFVFEMIALLAAQYLSAVDLIDRRDLVDAVAVQKNGVMRAIMLMLCQGIFVPRPAAKTARIVFTMATALVLCHGMVLHHADTLHLVRDDLANHQIVMTNALFLIMGAALATLATWVLRGPGGDDRRAAE
jgi:hypothetical protein